MVRGYLVNGSWPVASGTQPALVVPDQDQEPQTNPEPALPPEHITTDEASSLSLSIRVVQLTEQQTTPAELPRQQSRWRRFLQVIQGRAA